MEKNNGKSGGRQGAGFGGNAVINFACLFELVTVTRWVTGAESWSKYVGPG